MENIYSKIQRRNCDKLHFRITNARFFYKQVVTA